MRKVAIVLVSVLATLGVAAPAADAAGTPIKASASRGCGWC